MAAAATYPLRLEAELEPGLSRWLWLVKWFLSIPHMVVLTFLWVAFGLLTVVAWFAILFTGRYPRPIFEFNVGVLRWSWRVADYAFGVLGTDRYPPFTLDDVPTYPAHLEVAYPERLSRGLVLVKWILALPHLVIVAILAGGGTWVAWNVERGDWAFWGNLIGILVLVAAVILTFTGRYPRPLFDLILGLNRWVLRVGAYTGLMTDQYPPFRLDMGGAEPGGTLTIPRPSGPGPAGFPPRPDAPRRGSGWTGGRITSLVLGSLLGLLSLGLLAGGGFLSWAVATQRDARGYYSTDERRVIAAGAALTTSVSVALERGTGWVVMRGPGWAFGPGREASLRIRVTPTDPRQQVFVGVARAEDVARFLGGAARTEITRPADPSYRTIPGDVKVDDPLEQGFWTASNEGRGRRAVTWPIREGSWTVVVMNRDGSPGVDVRWDMGFRVPTLPAIASGLLIAGLAILVGSLFLIVVPIRRAGRSAWD